MNTVFRQTVLLGFIAATSVAMADGWVLFKDGDWRVSAGPVFDSGVKTRLRCDPHASFSVPYAAGLTAAEAERLAREGTPVSGTRRKYASGAWIDTDDDTTAMYGPDSKYTGYYHIPGRPGVVNEGSVFSLGSVPYAEVSSSSSGSSASFADKDCHPLPGVSLELDRTLYRDSERGWGVDLGFAFQYFYRRNVYKDSTAWSDSARVNEGAYEAKIDTEDAYISDNPNEDFNWGGGGTYYGNPMSGSGYYSGVINGDGVYSELAWSGVRQQSSRGSMYAKADYENLEMMFLVKPYYEVTDWFRIVGTLGLVVSRQNLEFAATISQNGTHSKYARHFHDWDVYGVAGIGASFAFDDFSIGVDFLARFFDDDMDIRSDCVRGDVERGDWMCRVMFGYRF